MNPLKGKAQFAPTNSPPRNISPLWSERPDRQSGFGLLGVGHDENDQWGSIL